MRAMLMGERRCPDHVMNVAERLDVTDSHHDPMRIVSDEYLRELQHRRRPER